MISIVKFCQRPADIGAFEYWGSLLESEKITKLELRKSILKSEEALSFQIFNRGEITESIHSIFHEVYELNGPYSEEILNPGYNTYSNTGLNLFDPRIDRDEFTKMVL